MKKSLWLVFLTVGLYSMSTPAYSCPTGSKNGPVSEPSKPAQPPTSAGSVEAPSPSSSTTPPEPTKLNTKKKVGIVLFHGFEVLDVYGPVEMWGYVPEFELITIAKQAGPIESSHGMATVAEHSFQSAPDLDLLLVPGGIGTLDAMKDPETLGFLRRQNQQTELTTSVCTGSMILAAAGILDHRRATSNKLYFQRARETNDKVKWIEEARWVDDGDLITSSGVTAGMDMALYVISRYFGAQRAEQLASGTEYLWNRDPNHDPFVAGARRPSATP